MFSAKKLFCVAAVLLASAGANANNVCQSLTVVYSDDAGFSVSAPAGIEVSLDDQKMCIIAACDGNRDTFKDTKTNVVGGFEIRLNDACQAARTARTAADLGKASWKNKKGAAYNQ